MKTIQLHSYDKTQVSDQNLFIKVVDNNLSTVLAITDNYPSRWTLPATFIIKSKPQLHLYNNEHISVQLWGDSSGFIGSSTIHMKEYKIQFPIDMETKEGTTSFSIAGTWE